MKALNYGFGLALIGGFSVMAACGGSSDDAGSTAGASSGGNGSNTAGASSTAGATANTGGAHAGGATSVAGGTATGGATASGGATAAGGASPGTAGAGQGGAGMTNPADCPATAPTEAAMCTPLATNQERCAYTGESCRCRTAMGGGMMQGTAGGGGAPAAAASTWQCTATCPMEKPTVGDDCTQGLNCQYQGMGRCTCGNTMKWACMGSATGMAGAPGAGGASGMAGAPGAGGATGTAGAGGATGTAGAGAGAGGASGAAGAGAANTCPVAKPTVGDACTVTKACPYGNTGCACVQEKWACL